MVVCWGSLSVVLKDKTKVDGLAAVKAGHLAVGMVVVMAVQKVVEKVAKLAA